MDHPHDAPGLDDTPEARFGVRLREVRVRAGLTVRRLATGLDRAHSTISDFENGRRLPGVEVVEQYEDFFGLSRGTLGAQRERARAERLESPRDSTVDENLGDVVCPYMGARPFERQDAGLFFGRETQVNDALAMLAEARFVALVGASGSGKTSFVRAGLLPAIQRAATGAFAGARVVLLAPGAHPLDALARAVGDAAGRAVTRSRGDGRLTSVARDAGGLVIVVDRLEELFTLCEDDVERGRFVEALIAASRDPNRRTSLILALRSDIHGRLAAYPELAAVVAAHRTPIGPMSPADLRRAIELPAARSGLVLQPGLADTMLEDLAGEPGALPLLSHALLQTWKRRRRLMLTVGAYHEAGGMRGAIVQRAERTLLGLPRRDRAVARSIFLSLTDVAEGAEPKRRHADRAELAVCEESARRERVLAVLAAARVVTLDERTVTVAHEALIRHWPRLRGWIEADREGLLIHHRLRDAAQEWQALDREPGALYQGARLATAHEWAAEHADWLSRLEHEFLAASACHEHGAQRVAMRRARRLSVLLAGIAVLTIVVAMLTVSALRERTDADRRSATRTSLALASAAARVRFSRPDVSLSLALEAVRARPGVTARGAVLAALVAARDPGVLAIMHGHSEAVRSVAFGPRGLTVASAGDDGTIRLWDARTHEQLGAPLYGHTSAVSDVTVSRDGRTLASAGQDETVRLWDVRTHRPLRRPPTLTEPVGTVAFSPDGRTLAFPDARHEIRLWDVRAHKALGAPLAGHTGSVYSVAFGPGGHTLASAGDDDTIRLWDLRTHKALGAPLRARDLAGTISFSPDGRTLASAGDDSIRLWNVRTHRQRGRPLRGHTDTITSVAFSPDGRRLASASYDRTVRLWSTRTHEQLGAPLTGHTDAVSSVAFSPDGLSLASGGYDRTIRLWGLRPRPRLSAPLRGHTGPAKSAAFSPDGRMLASAGDDATVRLWDVRAHRRVGAPLTGHVGRVESVAFSPDGRTLASAGDDATVRLWDARAHRRVGAPLTGHVGRVESVAFSPDGRMLASAGDDATVRLWDVRTRRRVGAPLTGHVGRIESVAFSPDGRTLASAGDDATIRLWDTHTHTQLAMLIAGDATVAHSVAFSPDGSELASANEDSTIRLWDTRTHKQLGASLTGHTGAVQGVAFSPDASTLASAGTDKTARLWDVRTHAQLGPPLTGHAGAVKDVQFAPGGRTLATAGDDDTLRLWDSVSWNDPAELQAMGCTLVGSGLSPGEWARYAPGIAYRRGCR